MRTYDKLEDYHWDEINKKELLKDKEIYFIDRNSDEIIKKGVIIGHDIHMEGMIIISVEVTKIKHDQVSDNIWLIDEDKRKYTYESKWTYYPWIEFCFLTKKEAIKGAKIYINSRIELYEDRIEFEKKRLEKLENE